VALEENNTYHWVPAAPLRMFYCEADMDVNYLNAQVAYDTMLALGATSISKQSAGPFYDHGGCAFPSLLIVKNWFDSLRFDKLKLAFDFVLESYLGANDGSLTVNVSGAYPPYTYSWSNGAATATISGLAAGNYTVTVTDSTGCPATASITLGVASSIFEWSASGYVVSPNPANEIIHIQFPQAVNYLVNVYSVTGERFFSEITSEKQLHITSGEWENGMYLLEITDANGNSARTIVCKIHGR
jgi:hypothetical protein